MFKKNFIADYLSDIDLDKIVKTIERIEGQTSGELRLSIKRKRGYLEKDLSSRDIAIKEFFNLNMNETIDKTGVLFFILLDDRKFEIIADEGINKLISSEKWKEFTDEIILHFSEKKYYEGILNLLEKVGIILIKEFPVKAGDKNELSNDVVIG
ncbi:MAG TPA: TPM domain-containing protein [Ignavibacteria bacterium]|nr:TPM domain-containing protein [Ignavibacteria bacterium]